MLLIQAATPRSHTSDSVRSIDISTNFEEITKKVRKLNNLLKSGVIDGNITWCLSGMDKLTYQGLVYFEDNKRSSRVNI